MINNRTDALKTDINLFFTITNCLIARSRLLTRRMNFKVMCLSAQCERAWISAVVVKKDFDASHYHILIRYFFLTALDGLRYSPDQKRDILNEYFYRLEEELLSSPEDYMQLTLWSAFIIIEKS